MVLLRVRRAAPLPPEERYPAMEPGVRAHVVETPDRQRVRLIEAGRGDRVAVVMLHGWGGCAYSFRHLLPGLASAGLRAIALDLLGHGASTRPADAATYERDRMVAHLRSVLDAASVGRAVLVGQSLGGALTLDLARADPARFPAALLLGSIGFTNLRRIQLARMLRRQEWTPQRVPRWVVALMLRRVYGRLRPWEARDVDEYWSPLREAGTTAALLAWARGYDWTIRPPLADEPPAVRLHMLFGERDRLIPSARALARAARFAGATSEVVPGGGHLLAEEAPDVVSSAILDLAAGSS